MLLIALGSVGLTAPKSDAAHATAFVIDCTAGGTGYQIVSPGVYRLARGVSECETGWAVDVNASHVVVDLNGYTVDGKDLATQRGVYVEFGNTDVVIRNGTVSDFYEAFNGLGVFSVRRIVSRSNEFGVVGAQSVLGSTFAGNTVGINVARATVRGNTVTDNTVGLVTSETLVKGNSVVGNNGAGISADRDRIIRNRISGNAGRGIDTTTNGSQAIGNIIEGNGDTGMRLLSDAVVRSNVVRGNGGSGILVDDTSTVVGNVASGNNFDGVRADAGNSIANNRASGNGDDGIEVLGPDSTTTLSRNTTNGNVDWGILAGAGVAGGRTNHATQNGQGLQCTPVTICVT